MPRNKSIRAGAEIASLTECSLPPRCLDGRLPRELSWLGGARRFGPILPQCDFRAIQSVAFPPPPISIRATQREVGEMILVKHGPQVAWRSGGKGILFQQSKHLRRALKQADHETQKPAVSAIVAKGGEPHLP